MTIRQTPTQALNFPMQTPPPFGEVVEIADGVLWLQLPLPFALDHVNIYLIRDGQDWVVLDSGIKTKACIQVWEDLLAGPLKGFTFSRVIITHLHPDHIGLAGWLCEKLQAPLLTSYGTYTGSKVISLDPRASESEHSRAFYLRHGMPEDVARIVSTRGLEYLNLVDELPSTFLRLMMGDVIEIGERQFRILTGDGHVPEQIMLYCSEDKLFFAADQVIEKISPNVSVWSSEPEGDPLSYYIRSLRALRTHLPDDVLVLPGHRRPFYGLHERCTELLDHHEIRCGQILEACKDSALSVNDLVPVLFAGRDLDAHQMSFAFTETMAHVNRLIRRKELVWTEADGMAMCRTV